MVHKVIGWSLAVVVVFTTAVLAFSSNPTGAMGKISCPGCRGSSDVIDPDVIDPDVIDPDVRGGGDDDETYPS